MVPTSSILNVIKKIAFKVFSSFIDKAAWDGYFVYACEKVNSIDVEDVKLIADFAYKKSSFKIISIIKEELSDRGYSLEIANKFIKEFIENIKDKDPVIYLLFDIDNLEESLANLEDKNSTIQKEIEAITNNPLYQINHFNIDEYDNYLKQCSKNNNDGTPCLDVFDFMDCDFTEDFLRSLNSESNPILICGEYQKETFLATLCELKKAFPSDYLEKVFILNSYEDYQKMFNASLPNEAILINSFFNADSIPVISKCINIHIVSKWKYKDAFIKLKPRMVQSTRAALERNGFSLDSISKLIRKRKNIFSHLFRELFNETDNYETRINESIDKRTLSTALLVNKFCLTSKNDVAFIEQLSGLSIDEFEERVLPPSLVETPFAKIVASYSQKQIVILDFEEAFRLFSDSIAASFVNRFFELSKKVICTLPEMYTIENYIRKNDEAMFSEVFLNSILESLLFFIVSNRYKRQCLDVVESFIKWVEESNTINHYKYFADYLNVLTEICPSLINQKIAKDISNKEGLFLLFNQKVKEDFLFPREKYVEVLWSLEKLLFLNNERKLAIKSLFELYRLGKEYRLTNNPKSSLQTFFLAWMKTTPATTKEKIERCNELFSIDSVDAWNLFSDLVYTGGGETASPFNGPRYIKYDRFDNRVSRSDIILVYKYYNDLIIEKAQSPEQIVKIIEKHSFVYFGEESIDKAFKAIKRVCKATDDEGKEVITSKIRSFIHLHRRHCDTDWAVSENIICKMERLLNSISFTNPEMKYIHLFKDYNIDEPHPIPFNHGDYDHLANEENEERYFDYCYNSFLKKNLNIDFLYSYFDQRAGKITIYYRFYVFLKRYEIEHNKKSFHSFANTLLEKTSHLSSLFSYFGRDLFDNHHAVYYEIADLLLKSTKDLSLKLEYLYSGSIDVNNNEYVSCYFSLSDELKNAYWKFLRSSINFNHQDSKSFCFIMDNLLSISPNESINNPYLEILYFFSVRYKNSDLPELVLKYLSDLDAGYITHGHFTYLPELLEILHNRYAFTDDVSIEAKIAALELLIIKGDDGRNATCLKNLLGRQPDLYYSFVDNMYINQVKDENYKGNLFYLLQFSLKFCPGYINNAFNKEIFENWLNRFKELVYSSNFEHKDWLYYSTLGKLFKHALPEDDLPMPKVVIDYIESIKEDECYKVIRDYYCIETNNSLGVRTISDGSDLISKANKYREQSKRLEEKGFIKTAEIFNYLADDFNNQGDAERKRAENEW